MEKNITVLTLICALLLAIPQMGSAQEEGVLLIGYGGEKFLPFLDGARYRFVVGERLILKAIGSDITVTLTTNKGEVYAFQIEEGEAEKVWTFRSADAGAMSLAILGGGRATLEVMSMEESALGWIELRPVGVVQTEAGLDEVLEAKIVGSTLSGFEAGEGEAAEQRIFARPNSTIYLQVPQGALGVKITLRHYDYIQLSGYIGTLHVRYRVEPIIAEYSLNETSQTQAPTSVAVRLPPLGETGEGGLIPLRYGTIIVSLVYAGRGGGRFEQTYEVLVTPFLEEPPAMSSVVSKGLRELLHTGLRVISLNLTTGVFEPRTILVPNYRVRVYDSHLNEWVEDYSVSFTGYLSLKNGTETVIIPRAIPITEQDQAPKISLKPLLTVYSVDLSQRMGVVDLEEGRTSTIFVDGRRVKVEVRHAAGFLIREARIYVNDSFRGGGGELSLKLPAGVYNFSADTPFGIIHSVEDVREVTNVVLLVRGYTAETLALITIFLVQLSVFMMYAWRWYKLVRRASSLVGGRVEARN